MRHRKQILMAFAACASSMTPAPVVGQTTKSTALLDVADDCVLAKKPFQDLTKESGTDEAAILAPLLAGLAGSLIQSAVNGIANAIDSAASEHTFQAMAVDGFHHGRVEKAKTGSAPYSYSDKPRCAILVVPDKRSSGRSSRDEISLSELENVPDLETALPTTGSARMDFRKALSETFQLDLLPLAYAEVAILPTAEGLQLTPLYVWYRKALPGASDRRSQKAELHVALATPSYAASGDPIGTVYAFSRFELPRLRPGNGTVLRYDQLKGLNPIFHPGRTTSDLDRATATRANAILAAYDLKRAERAQAQAAFDLAVATRQDEDTAANRYAEAARKQALEAAIEAEKKAMEAKDALPDVTSEEFQSHGRTNARMTFLVIRDEDKFGKAIAAALKGQAEAAGKAATSELTPKPAWAASDTSYVSAKTALDTAQAALDAAILEGDPNKIAAAEGAVLVAKAKLNEAAVGLGRTPPYPNILD